MKKTALLALVLVGLSGPTMARSHYARHHHYAYRERSAHHYVYRERSDHHYVYRERSDRHYAYRERSDRHYAYRGRADHHLYGKRPANSHANITCDMVRAYVAQAGVVQARAMAKAAGMTASDERRAKRCLENGA